MATTSPPVPSRRRLPLIVAGGLLLLIALTASGIARLFTDYLFFDKLGFASSWGKILITQMVLAVAFTLAFFGILFGNLTIADRLKPDVRPPSPEEDLIERYHQLVDGHANRIRVLVAATFALVAIWMFRSKKKAESGDDTRPALDDLLQGIDYVLKNDYPTRGTLA